MVIVVALTEQKERFMGHCNSISANHSLLLDKQVTAAASLE
jgi:hypothetical protein